MKKPTLYLDLDDTLFDTKRQMTKLLGPLDLFQSRKDMWITLMTRYPRFFVDIPPFDGFDIFVKTVDMWCESNQYDLQILTALPLYVPSKIFMYDKICCVSKYIEPVVSRQLTVNFGPFSENKQNWVSNNIESGIPDILIDNSPTNIRQWTTAGGKGVLHTDFASSLKMLRNNT